MENNIESIRAALALDASPEARAIGAAACREILGALEPAASDPQPPSPDLAQLAQTALTMLRNVPPDRLLDLAIDTLRAKLPKGTTIAPVRPLALPFLPTRRPS